MENGSEKNVDECPVLDVAGLAKWIGHTESGIKQLLVSDPGMLPPRLFLGGVDARIRHKRIWLKITVLQWLQDQQKQSSGQGAAPVSVVPSVCPMRRTRGRPRKVMVVDSREGGAA
jgi:hypothetical protein